MSRIVNLTVTLKLELASQLESSYFYDNLSEMLRSGLGEVLAVDATAVQVVACTDPELTLSYFTDLRPLLAPSEQIAIVWSVDDVLEVRPGLTREQAFEVLEHAMNNHDAGIGINWYTLEYLASELYGDQIEQER